MFINISLAQVAIAGDLQLFESICNQYIQVVPIYIPGLFPLSSLFSG